MQRNRILASALAVGALLAAAASAVVVVPVREFAQDFGAVAVLLSLVAVAAAVWFTLTPRARYVAAYRLACIGHGLRAKLGAWLLSWMFRSGAALAAFPGLVNMNIGAGVPGEWSADGPRRALARILKGTAANIVVGRWFTIDPVDGQAQPGGAGAVGGVLISPKNYASVGAGGVPLAPTMTLPAGSQGELAYMGRVWVALAGAVNEGDPAKVTTATGVIGSGAPGAGETAIPNSRFRTTNAAAGLAELELTN